MHINHYQVWYKPKHYITEIALIKPIFLLLKRYFDTLKIQELFNALISDTISEKYVAVKLHSDPIYHTLVLHINIGSDYLVLEVCGMAYLTCLWNGSHIYCIVFT